MSDLVSFTEAEGKNLEVFAMTTWLIWLWRNKLRTNDNPLPCSKIAQTASSLLSEFQQGKQWPVTKNRTNLVRWQASSGNSVKVNFDGAIFKEEQESGIGVVIRNNKGQVLAALSKKVTIPATVEILEMLAARKAATFARDLGFSQVCFEGDAELVVKCLQSGSVSNALVGHLAKDFMSIRGYFQSSSIIHVRRQGNKVAHALAGDARFSFPFRAWMEEVPSNIFNFVVRDLP